MRKHFGTDGVRGIANEDLTVDLALKLGASAAGVLSDKPHGVQVLIGRDPRISGDMLESALAAGFASRGADVILVGVIPTPGVACLVKHSDASIGCVISASHNSVEYNGIKFFGNDGEKLPDSTELEIENQLDGCLTCERPTGVNVGRFLRQPERTEIYVERVKASCRVRLDGLKLVVDGANGAASAIAPRVFRELGAEVVSIHCDPDGANINKDCGSLHVEHLMEMVVREKAHAGMAFDGDADRVIMCCEKGGKIDGDTIMAICAIDMASRGKLPGNRVVATVMSNIGLEKALTEAGLVLDRVDEVGDRYVAERMRETGAAIGGEKSGHIILTEFSGTGDGMITALQVLSSVVSAGKPLSELASVVTEYPQLLDGVRVKDKSTWTTDPDIQKAISDAAAKLEGRGRIHVRASGTEPLIRVMAEGPDQEELKLIVGEVCQTVRSALGVN